MTCQAYPRSGIITLFWMGYTASGKLVLLPLVPALTGASGFLIIFFLFPLTFKAVNVFKQVRFNIGPHGI